MKETCPFCGKCWEKKEEKAHHRWLKEVEQTVVAIITTTGMVLLLKFLGI